MKLIYHTFVFGFFCLLCLIAGSIAGARYATFREVKCLSYYDHEYINIIDYSGLQSIGIASFPKPKTPSICWTDGIFIKSYNQKTLVFGIVGIIGSLILIYIIFAIIEDNISKKYQDLDIDETYYLDKFGTEQEQLFHIKCTSYFVIIMVCLAILAYISTMSYFKYYNSNYHPAICTSYAKDSWQYANFVIWEESNGNNGSYAISTMSSRPTYLPACCWISDDSVSFYKPTDLYLSSTVIFIIVVSILILYWFLAKYQYKKTSALVLDSEYDSIHGEGEISPGLESLDEHPLDEHRF